MRRKSWLPKVTRGPKTKFAVDGTEGFTNLDGTPTIVRLNRLSKNDKTIRGDITNECCNCSMVHLYSVEVFKVDEEFWLAKRAYRIKDGESIPKKRGRRKK